MHIIPVNCVYHGLKTLNMLLICRPHVLPYLTLIFLYRQQDIFFPSLSLSSSLLTEVNTEKQDRTVCLNFPRASQHVTDYFFRAAPPTVLTFLSCVCVCVFLGWRRGAFDLRCSQTREVVFQTRYGGSVAERKTPLTLGNFT